MDWGHRYNNRKCYNVLVLLILCFLPAFLFAVPLTLAPQLLNQIEQENGVEAKNRVLQWEALINNNLQETDLVKLRLVNDFFNKMQYALNADQPGRPHYWPTPLDFIVAAKGDCEEFAISKYFTLRAMGIPVDKLRLAFVKAIKLNQAHMVLTYYETPTEDPFILDNLRDLILYATERPDLKPVYSFNGDGLWVSNSLVNEKAGKKVGDTNNMVLWIDLKQRMAKQGLILY